METVEGSAVSLALHVGVTLAVWPVAPQARRRARRYGPGGVPGSDDPVTSSATRWHRRGQHDDQSDGRRLQRPRRSWPVHLARPAVSARSSMSQSLPGTLARATAMRCGLLGVGTRKAGGTGPDRVHSESGCGRVPSAHPARVRRAPSRSDGHLCCCSSALTGSIPKGVNRSMPPAVTTRQSATCSETKRPDNIFTTRALRQRVLTGTRSCDG